MGSILIKIKQALGIQADETSFDTDVLMHINTAIMSLAQMGLKNAEGFMVTDSSAVWEDLSDNKTVIGACQTYIYIKTKLVFDPPNHSFVITALQESLRENEWRLSIELDPVSDNKEVEEETE